MTRLVRLRLPAATVIMLGVFPRHWGGEFDGRQYAEDAWPNPLAKVPCHVIAVERPLRAEVLRNHITSGSCACLQLCAAMLKNLDEE